MSAPSRHRVWPWILAILGTICLLPVVIVATHIGLSSEARVLRDELKTATGSTWSTRVQLSSGPLLIPAARAVVSFCNVDEDARSALAAVRSASVGVYEIDEAGDSPGLGAGLASLDARLGRNGWERLITVIDNKENVVVYTKAGGNWDSKVRVCIGVVTGRELVVVSATVRPEALMPLIDKHLQQAKHRL
ncbi:MAG TPA: hypothetical protein VMM36_17480 [Opitutaceae bacterium]|nr:hypothetical protein [Opitutaceae bacterium]